MENTIDPLDRPVHGGGVDDIALNQFNPLAEGGQVRQVAGAEIIEHADPVATLHEGLGDVRSNESGPAGHEESSHAFDSRWKSIDFSKFGTQWDISFARARLTRSIVTRSVSDETTYGLAYASGYYHFQPRDV